MKKAIGFLECAGLGAAMYAMDRACKQADVQIIGIDTINPKDTTAFIPLTTQVKFSGSLSDVKEAAQTAYEAALTLNKKEEVIISVIEYPYEGTTKLGNISKIELQKL